VNSNQQIGKKQTVCPDLAVALFKKITYLFQEDLNSFTGSGVHTNSYKMGTGGSFSGVKRQRREADHSPSTSAEVKKMWIYTSTPLYVYMA
jgi:hypothetical protein